MRGWVKAALLFLPLMGVSGGAVAVEYDTSAESNARFLADYAKLKDVVKLPDGLMYRVIESGTNGTSPVTKFDTVTVQYRGLMINGKVFDQSKPEEPRQFTTGALIPGWREALMKMKTGDMWQLVVPASLAYGEDGVGGTIPPNQTLIFVVRLVKVEYAP